MKPRISAKARRQALAARIARELFTGGTGAHATRLVMVHRSRPWDPDEKAERGGGIYPSEDAIGGWNEKAAATVIEAHLRRGQRRRSI